MRRSGSAGKKSTFRTLVFVAVGAVAVSHGFHDAWPLLIPLAFLGGMTVKRRLPMSSANASSLPQTQTAWTPPAPVRPAAPPPRAYVQPSYAPPQRHPAAPPKPLSPSAQIAARLDGLVERISKLVSNDVLSLVKSIVTSIEEILPMLDNDAVAVGDADAFTIRQTALHYLPDTMAAYFRLPPSYRTTQPLENGKTARAILIEQLTVLDHKMKEVSKNLAGNDAQALLANGHFLRERFATDIFTTV